MALLAASSLSAESATPSPTPKVNKAAFDTKMFGDKNDTEPTLVDSDSLSVNSQTRVFTYTGHVTVKHGDITLTSEIIEGQYNEKNEIQIITAKQNVVITRPPALKATGQKAIYDAVQATVVLTENPALEQEGSSLTADQIKVYLKDNRSEAIGQVHVRMIKKPDLENEKAKTAATASPTPSPTASATPTPTPTPNKSQAKIAKPTRKK